MISSSVVTPSSDTHVFSNSHSFVYNKLPTTVTISSDFSRLWALRPDKRLELKLSCGRVITCPRYTRVFFKPFLALQTPEPTLPKEILHLFLHCQGVEHRVNRVIVNWFEHDGSIATHPINTDSLEPGSTMFCLFFCAGRVSRKILLRPRQGPKTGFRLSITHGTALQMSAESADE